MKIWAEIINAELGKLYMKKINASLKAKRAEGRLIYPEAGKEFYAFKCTPFDRAKVVILGQDPYHDGSAHGLAFSSLKEKRPPSLSNICKEINNDILKASNADEYSSLFVGNDLTCWAVQGVLLLNTHLTVEAGKPGSHHSLGWETFTNEIIGRLYHSGQKIVWMLWGNHAQRVFSQAVSEKNENNLILAAAHPSPYSASGFFGCRHFSKANIWLHAQGLEQISWKIKPITKEWFELHKAVDPGEEQKGQLPQTKWR